MKNLGTWCTGVGLNLEKWDLVWCRWEYIFISENQENKGLIIIRWPSPANEITSSLSSIGMLAWIRRLQIPTQTSYYTERQNTQHTV